MKSNAINKKSITSVSDFAELERIRDFVRCSAMKFGFAEDEAQKISLAVDEAVSNLIKHAFHLDSEKQIKIEVESRNNWFTVNILDDGKPFNPLEVDTPNMIEYLKNYEKGGLGIHIMKLVMDKIDYVPSHARGDSRNILRLSKQLN
jgi:serine/threonine-protein kinase RsbW